MPAMRQIDLMIIGAQKAGTTALNHYLGQHPDVLGHPQTEFAYFRDDNLFAEGYEPVFRRHFTQGDPATARVVIGKNAGIYDSETALACERLIRTYDPCISCSTHFLKLRIERT